MFHRRVAFTSGCTVAGLLLLSSLVQGLSASCGGAIDEPIEYRDGDYIVAGIFWIGDFVETSADNYTYPDGYCLNYTKASFWGVQRALVFRKIMREKSEDFRYTL